MIQREVPHLRLGPVDLRTCSCNRAPLLIESTGNNRTTLHLECSRCAICTAPSSDPRRAVRDWNDQRTHPLADLRILRASLPPHHDRIALTSIAGNSTGRSFRNAGTRCNTTSHRRRIVIARSLTNIVPLRATERSAVVCVLRERAAWMGATQAQRNDAIATATRELNAGRSPAVAAAIGLSSLSGRRTALLTKPAA